MTAYIMCYNSFALFETILISYFFNAKKETKMIGIDKKVISSEGITINTDNLLNEIQLMSDDVLVIPGGNINNLLGRESVSDFVRYAFNKGIIIGCICSGRDYISNLNLQINLNINKIDIHTVCEIGNVIMAPPEFYLKFALKLAKKADIFDDELDYKETVDFFKGY